jgi:hemerythrin-like domain-containing protein
MTAVIPARTAGCQNGNGSHQEEEQKVMLLKVDQPVDHGFDSPVGLLGDCHRRVERFLGILVAVTREWQGRPLPPPAEVQLEQALRYFEVAGPRHTADEEESLFPRLERLDTDGVRCVVRIARELEADHRIAEGLHRSTAALIRTWIAGGALPPDDRAALSRDLDELARLYARHIEIEDTQVFPAAARALSADALEQIGREMAARRGVPYAPPDDFRA